MPPKKRTTNLVKIPNIHAIDIILIQYGDVESTYENVNTRTFIEEEKNSTNSKNTLYFLDPKRHNIVLWLNMYDTNTSDVLPIHTNKPCWRCHKPFTTSPLGCPLRFISNVSDERRKEIKQILSDYNLPYDEKDMFYFETEGLFCSFPCMKAFIKKNQKKVKYRDSFTLMTLMQFKIFGIIDEIPSSDHWKVLKDYGGNKTIDQYRESFGMSRCIETTNMKRPLMFNSSAYIQETKVK